MYVCMYVCVCVCNVFCISNVCGLAALPGLTARCLRVCARRRTGAGPCARARFVCVGGARARARRERARFALCVCARDLCEAFPACLWRVGDKLLKR